MRLSQFLQPPLFAVLLSPVLAQSGWEDISDHVPGLFTGTNNMGPLLAHGDVPNSLRANWVGSTICTLWAVTLVWAAASAAWGQMLLVPPGRGELVFTIIVGAVVFLMLVRWGMILIQG